MAVDEVQKLNLSSLAQYSQEKSRKQPESQKEGEGRAGTAAPRLDGEAGGQSAEASRQSKRMEAAQQLNDFMKRYSIQLKFSVDADTKELVVKVVQSQTGKVIRQVPTEEALKIAKAFESLQGLIVQKRV